MVEGVCDDDCCGWEGLLGRGITKERCCWRDVLDTNAGVRCVAWLQVKVFGAGDDMKLREKVAFCGSLLGRNLRYWDEKAEAMMVCLDKVKET